MATLYAGTSGFAYAAWKPAFYPAKLPSSQFLKHYATRLNCVEINYTFRRLPSAKTLEAWVEATPPGFRIDGFLNALVGSLVLTILEIVLRNVAWATL